MDLAGYVTVKQLDEVRGKFLKDIEELTQGFKKLSLQISTSGEKSNVELEQVKKTVYQVESEVSTKLSQMFLEMEGFIKARKRDKNDQNALIRNLQGKVGVTEKETGYNRQAIENVATSMVMILETI